MEEVSLLGLMAEDMMENTMMTRNQGMESLLGQMVENMRVIG